MSRFYDGDDPVTAHLVREFRRLARRKNNVHPQPQEVLASWCAPYQSVLPGGPKPARRYGPWETARGSDYLAYENEMDW